MAKNGMRIANIVEKAYNKVKAFHDMMLIRLLYIRPMHMDRWRKAYRPKNIPFLFLSLFATTAVFVDIVGFNDFNGKKESENGESYRKRVRERNEKG